MGRLVLEVTYGTEITKFLGEELASWNVEAMELINGAFGQFRLVDVFHFCKWIQWSCSFVIQCSVSTFHTELDARCHLQVWTIFLLMKRYSRDMHVGKLATGHHGCRIKSDTSHSRLLRNFMYVRQYSSVCVYLKYIIQRNPESWDIVLPLIFWTNLGLSMTRGMLWHCYTPVGYHSLIIDFAYPVSGGADTVRNNGLTFMHKS